MNTHLSCKTQTGYTLVLIAVLTAVSIVLVSGVLSWSSTTSKLKQRNTQFCGTLAAAEAATEKVVSQISRDFQTQGEQALNLNLTTYSALVPQLLEATERAGGQHRGRATSCILFFLKGGQSQIETFDMKPDAPAQIRGEFRPIASTVPGLQVCEHLPRLARVAHKFALIRSMTHRASNHNPATYYALTGVPPSRDIVALGTSPDDYPNPGAVVARLLPRQRPVPPFVQLSPPLVGDASRNAGGQTAGFLSAAYDPFKVSPDPNHPDFDVPELSLPAPVNNQRLDRRRSLLRTVEEEFPLINELPEIDRIP